MISKKWLMMHDIKCQFSTSLKWLGQLLRLMSQNRGLNGNRKAISTALLQHLSLSHWDVVALSSAVHDGRGWKKTPNASIWDLGLALTLHLSCLGWGIQKAPSSILLWCLALSRDSVKELHSILHSQPKQMNTHTKKKLCLMVEWELFIQIGKKNLDFKTLTKTEYGTSACLLDIIFLSGSGAYLITCGESDGVLLPVLKDRAIA